MTHGWSNSRHNNNDIKNRARKIDEIGGRLSQFFADCASEETKVFFSTTEYLTTHFTISVQIGNGEKGYMEDKDRIVLTVMGNGRVTLEEYKSASNDSLPLHEFEIRTKYDIGHIFEHAAYELAIHEDSRDALMNYGVDVFKGIHDAQNEEPPEPRIKPKAPPIAQRPRSTKGLQV